MPQAGCGKTLASTHDNPPRCRVLAALIRYIDAQNPDEVARQYTFLMKTATSRLALTAVAYVLAMMFLPFWLCFVLLHIDTLAELLCLHLMRGIDPARQRWRYVGTHLCLAVGSVCYTFAAASVWQLETPFARPFAVAMIAMAIVQLLTVRSVHLAYGLTGWTVQSVTSLLGVYALWVNSGGDQAGVDQVMILSTISVYVAATFVMLAMLSNHALHVGLVQGRAAAQAADRAKGRFLAQISHELRTPLNAIIGMGEAELTKASSEDTRMGMGVRVGSARGLAVILDDILDMSAIGQDRLPVRPVCASPAAEIKAVTGLFEQVFSTAGLTLTVDIAPDLPAHARFDAQRLRQCLTNLLSNAAKFTPHGGATVKATLDGDNRLLVVVADTGPGIAPDVQATLFQPFERGLSAQSGSGLGLSISRALARGMGGDLVLVPGPAGAVFCLTIEITPLAGADTAQAIAPIADLSGFRVLVIDDIATNRLVAATYLGLWQAQVSQAVGGAEAVAMINADPPDLVLLDMNMPGLDGAATLALIRALPGRCALLPVVAMTADASDAHRAQYIAAGFDGYVAKPLTPETLQAAIVPLLAGAIV